MIEERVLLESTYHRKRLPERNPVVVRGGALVEQTGQAHKDGRHVEAQRDGDGEQGQVPEVHEQAAARGVAGLLGALAGDLGHGRREQVQGEEERDGRGPRDILEDDAEGADPGDGAAAVAGAPGLEHERRPAGGELRHAPDVERGDLVAGAGVVDQRREEGDEHRELLVQRPDARERALDGQGRARQLDVAVRV